MIQVPGGGGDAQSSAGFERGVVPALVLQKSSQFSETEARMTGCGDQLLGRGCTLSRLIGLMPLLRRKTTAGVKCRKKENGISFSSGSKHIY
jgi:hypothetical protein